MADSERLYAVNAAAARFYAGRLASSRTAGAYLRGHGITDAGGPWQLGYAPGRWTELASHLRAEGFGAEEVTAAGLGFVHRTSGHLLDRFRDRLMFPITDRNNRVIAFTARDLSGRADARWMNSPETDIYRKRLVLYGLGQQLAHPPDGTGEPVVFVVEGAADVIAMHRMTAAHSTQPTYAVAPCGTSLTPDQLSLLHEVLPDAHLVLAFDGDNAGRRAVDRAYPVAIKWPGKVSGTRLPAGKDPAEMLAETDPRRAMSEIDGSLQPLARVQMTNTIRRLFETGRITRPAEYAGDRITAYQAIAELFIDAPHASRQMAEAAAEQLGVTPADVTRGVVEAWGTHSAAVGGPDPPPTTSVRVRARPSDGRLTVSASARSSADAGRNATAVATRHNDATGVSVWALADGIGQHRQAMVAAAMAADIAAAVALHSAPEAGLIAARAAINAYYGSEHVSQAGDASLVVVSAHPAQERRHGVRFELAWTGDCRVYTISDGRLDQVTADHTVARQRREAGESTPQTGLADLLLTSSVRAGDIGVSSLGHGPLLVCNNTVHRAVPENTLALELTGLTDAAATAERLVGAVGSHSGRGAVALLIHAASTTPALVTTTGPSRAASVSSLAKGSFAATTPAAPAAGPAGAANEGVGPPQTPGNRRS